MFNLHVDHKKTFIQPRMTVRATRIITFISELLAPIGPEYWVPPPMPDFPGGGAFPLPNKFPAGQSLPMQILPEYQYDQLFPNCQMMPDIMSHIDLNPVPNLVIDDLVMNGTRLPTFYVKKFLEVSRTNLPGAEGRERTVTFIATLDELPEDVNSYREFVRYVRTRNEWISFSLCRNDRIASLKTNDRVRLSDGRIVSARRCGMASLLAYLCFIDSDHLTSARGYMIQHDGKWNHGNMPQLSGLGFNNDRCNRMIRVDWETYVVMDTTPQASRDRDQWPGNKAIMYGAVAAKFYNMVSYNPIPCPRQRPPCCMGNEENGHAFNTKYLVDLINLRDPRYVAIDAMPRGPRHMSMSNFMQHYGRTWYFCQL